MAKYILKRVLMAVITLFIVICLTFFLMNAIPGSPWLSEKTPPQATIDALNEKYGLDQPVIVQLGKYLANIVHGDFGTSIKMQKDRPVLDIITTMFPVSATIGIIAILWAILVGVPLGCLAAYKRGTWVDSLLRVICTIGISMPGFVVATILLYLLAGGIDGFKIFPTIFDGSLKSYVLPCLALGLNDGVYLRYGGCDRARLDLAALKSQLAAGLLAQGCAAAAAGGCALALLRDPWRKGMAAAALVYYLLYTCHNFLGHSISEFIKLTEFSVRF